MTAVRERVADRYRELYGRAPDLLVRAPGRVNLLGAHVDYNEGWVLPGAIDRSIWLAAGRGAGATLRASSLELGTCDPVSLRPAPLPRAAAQRPSWGWIEYAAGVAWALGMAGRQPCPLDAVVGSELPPGAGLSSSAALEVAFLVAWRELGSFALDDLDAARLCRRVENEYVGVQSGLMDPFASLFGRRDHLLLLDCRSLEWERLALPGGVGILVADSGVRRRLVDGALNDRRGECAAALRVLQERFPDLELRALRDVTPETLAAAGFLPEHLGRRVRHVVGECDRVRRGAALLRSGSDSAAELGALISESHAGSRDLYQVSIPELDALVESATGAPGCHGARLVGAGGGGCVVAVVDEERVPAVEATLAAGFAARFGRRPPVHRCSIGDGAAVE